jgi:hypothetical protein
MADEIVCLLLLVGIDPSANFSGVLSVKADVRKTFLTLSNRVHSVAHLPVSNKNLASELRTFAIVHIAVIINVFFEIQGASGPQKELTGVSVPSIPGNSSMDGRSYLS